MLRASGRSALLLLVRAVHAHAEAVAACAAPPPGVSAYPLLQKWPAGNQSYPQAGRHGSSSAPLPSLPQPQPWARVLPLIQGSAASQPSSGPPKSADLRPNPLTGTSCASRCRRRWVAAIPPRWPCDPDPKAL